MEEDDGRFVATGSGVVDGGVIGLADSGIPGFHVVSFVYH
jgi:hypothetical protein